MHKIERSSAYGIAFTFGEIVLVKSFKKIRNSVGEMTPPCRTPCWNDAVLL